MAVGASGVVHSGGLILNDDYDRAWQDGIRDRTIIRMLNDPIIGAAMSGIEMLIRRVTWAVEPANDTNEALNIADFVKSCLEDMNGAWPGTTMSQILTYIGWGWSVLETVYKVREGRMGKVPSRFNDGKIGWAAWNLIPQWTRYGWAFNAAGYAEMLIQVDPQTAKYIPISLQRCIHFHMSGRSNSPEGWTPLRQAYDPWYRKMRIQQIEGVGIERDLAGLPHYMLPAEDIEKETPAFLRARKIVTGIRQDSQAGLVTASDRDEDSGQLLHEFKLLSTGGARSIETDPIVRRYANEVAMTFLAGVMRAGQDSHGSHALAETQGGLLEQSIGAHLDSIQADINTQALPDLMEFNTISEKLTPVIKHSGIASRDLEALARYVATMQKAGLLITTPELTGFLHQVAGLPVPRLDQLRTLVKEKQAAAETEASTAAAQLPVNDATNGVTGIPSPNNPLNTNNDATTGESV